jgi:malate synthase
MNTELLYKQEIPGFSTVFQSVRRLAAFHKIEMEDAASIAAEAALAHPNNVQAAIKMARRALNNQRRQRLPARMVDDRVDAGVDEELDVVVDCRTLPMGLTLAGLDDEGEYQQDRDVGDQDHDGVSTDLSGHDLPDLPLITPSDSVSLVIFFSRYGYDIPEIAKRAGITPRRVRQILRDTPAIRRAVDRAQAQMKQPSLLDCPVPTEVRPREPRHHKRHGRVPRAVLPASDQTPHQQLSLF